MRIVKCHWVFAAVFTLAAGCSGTTDANEPNSVPTRPNLQIDDIGDQEPPEEAPAAYRVPVAVKVTAIPSFNGNGFAVGQALVAYAATDVRATVELTTSAGTAFAEYEENHTLPESGAISAIDSVLVGRSCAGTITADANGEAWWHFLFFVWGRKKDRDIQSEFCPNVGSGGGAGGGGTTVYYIECTGNLVYELGADGRWHFVGVEDYSCSSTPIYLAGAGGEWQI